MKRLVIVGEGHGETAALPILIRRLLREKDAGQLLFVDDDVIRTHEAASLVKWDKQKNRPDYGVWISRVALASRRSILGAVLAVFDGDSKVFPAGSGTPFCAATAAKSMTAAAVDAGAGKVFSLAVVFACVEFETWIIAGAESLAGQSFKDGRPALPAGMKFPAGPPESHGKRWLEEHCPGYRPTRDQGPLTELIDFNIVREKKLRSFARLEHAVEQILTAVGNGDFIKTPI